MGVCRWERGGSDQDLSFTSDVSTATKLPEPDLQDRRRLHRHYTTSRENISGVHNFTKSQFFAMSYSLVLRP